jgi:hypothetical protein
MVGTWVPQLVQWRKGRGGKNGTPVSQPCPLSLSDPRESSCAFLLERRWLQPSHPVRTHACTSLHNQENSAPTLRHRGGHENKSRLTLRETDLSSKVEKVRVHSSCSPRYCRIEYFLRLSPLRICLVVHHWLKLFSGLLSSTYTVSDVYHHM